ncbi:DNA polymerase III subunit chi [Oryzibacter oryziterrae]|uniref:DNA polymerase III subunit chi n=1 Tax=Oryzibacter oryziterrae TaxID=2766474 RepID=UPI001F01B125|nr:DNA polymerase III subunit chi [Oryzibacter oryziterrae]
MTEVLFYHLDSQSPERVLPVLLGRSLERGWKVVVQAGSRERLEVIDSHLWTFDDAAFLPHGTVDDGHAALQPIFLTTEGQAPNSANVRILVDRAPLPDDISRYDRVVILFDGTDTEALAEARQNWKTLKDGGLDISYWQQADGGKWVRKA